MMGQLMCYRCNRLWEGDSHLCPPPVAPDRATAEAERLLLEAVAEAAITFCLGQQRLCEVMDSPTDPYWDVKVSDAMELRNGGRLALESVVSQLQRHRAARGAKTSAVPATRLGSGPVPGRWEAPMIERPDIVGDANTLLAYAATLERAAEALRSALKALEWDEDTNPEQCAWCLGIKTNGHLDGCRFAALLAALTGWPSLRRSGTAGAYGVNHE